MAESHVVSALVDKRSEIAGLVARMEQEIGQCRSDLVHLDAAIRLFAPELGPSTIRAKVIRRSDDWFEPGEVSRAVLDTLRRAGRPTRAPEIVRAVMEMKGLDPADRPSFDKIRWKVLNSLRGHARRGLVVASNGARREAFWEIGDPPA
jgi:hypothetical protein